MAHLDDLVAALERERRALRDEHARLRALSLPDRVAAGFTWAPLEIVDTEYRSKGRVNVLLRGRDLHDGIGPGDPVVLAPAGRPDDGILGRVEGVDGGTVELRIEGTPEGRGPWAVSRRLDFTVMDLQIDALRRAELKRTPLKDLLLGYEKPYRPDPLDHPSLAGLDPSQREAAALALGATEIGLVHGPPGTGKTEVLVAILAALKDLGEKPWALADSNAAVDHLAVRAAARGLDVVRIGVSARVGGEARALTLEHRILHGPRAKVIEALQKQISRAPDDGELRAALREEWSQAKREILENADVLAMTLGTLHTRGKDYAPPRTAVVDEASQIVEPALWLLASKVKRILLAGDPLQLGPVVKSRDPVLERTLLQRLVDEGFLFPMLTNQRRMNAEIMRLAQHTYGGRLTASPDVLLRRLADLPGVTGGTWTAPPARWLDTAGMGLDEEQDALGSWFNPGEVRLVQRVWKALEESGVRPAMVGVIAPYSAQVARLRAALPETIEVGTVNAFQGREKDVIVASFVRSNAEGELGFVSDPRRLNVAVTRARRLFVGVGDSATLGRSPAFARLLESVGDGYVSAWELEG
ncbi:MAG: AAA domain-containing protein [Myxococcota bacterium]